MTTGLLTTVQGRAKILADIGGGANLNLTHVAVGDAGGGTFTPNENQTQLINERYRAPISSMGVVDGQLIIEAVIPADTPDATARPSHGFALWEVGLFDDANTLIGVARLGGGFKPSPASGQASQPTLQLGLACANPSAIAVTISAAAQIHIGRHVRAPWLTVDGVLNAPPGAPAIGATYVIGAAPTGAWAGFAHRIAQWVGFWIIAPVPVGHVVCDNTAAVAAAGRFLRFTGAAWVSAQAATDALGFARLATAAEANSGAAGAALDPSGLLSLLDRLPIYPDVRTPDGRLTLSHSVGSLVVTGAVIRMRGTYDTDLAALSLAQRTFATAPNKTYHLRFDRTDGLRLRDLADVAYNHTALAENNAAFDTFYGDALLARVVTSGGNVLTVTPLANIPSWDLFTRADVLQLNTPWAMTGSQRVTYQGLVTLNWSRRPRIPAQTVTVTWDSGPAQARMSGGHRWEAMTLDRYGISWSVSTDWDDFDTINSGAHVTRCSGSIFAVA